MSNAGIYSKFQERLRRMKLLRQKKKQNNDEFVEKKIEEIRKSVENTPVKYRYGPLAKGISDEKEYSSEEKKIKVCYKGAVKPKVKLVPDKSKEFIAIKDSVDVLKEKKPIYFVKTKVGIPVKEDDGIEEKSILDKNLGDGGKAHGQGKEDKVKGEYRGSYVKRIKAGIDREKEEEIKSFGASIINKIKGSFEDKLNELEVLESELFILNEKQKDAIELKKVREIKKEIQELIEKINVIIEQYNLYNRNYGIENVIWIDDSVLVDDIIKYRDLLDGYNDEKRFVKEYKLLDEFRGLYSSLTEIKEKTEHLKEDNEEKINNFNVRDKKYDEIKEKMILPDKLNKDCNDEIEKQNAYFDELMKKIGKIDSETYTTYHLNGIGNLIGQSLRYVGLMIASPLRGLIPGIAMEAIATRRMIGNIYNNMHFEERRHIRYVATDFDSEIRHNISDVGYANGLVEDTLKDISMVKEDFLRMYDSRLKGYDETLKKIERLEEAMIRNQYKLEVIRKNLEKSKKMNEDKMIRVRAMNENKG